MTKRLVTGDPETDRLMREAYELEHGKKLEEVDDGPPVTTFLEYQEKATMHNNYPNMVTPALGLSAAAGRLALATIRESGERKVPEEEIAKDLAHVLYYLTAMCDRNEVTLQKVAEISLAQLRIHQNKKLRQ